MCNERSEEAFFSERKGLAASNYYVVDYTTFDERKTFLQPLGYEFVCAGCVSDPGRVLMEQNARCRIFRECHLHHGPRVD